MQIKNLGIILLACGAPLAARAGVDIGVNIGIPGPVGGEIYVRGAPPAEIRESAPAAPGPGYIWMRGHWSWHQERGWVWVHGRWERPVQPGAVWIEGHWDRRDRGWIWIEGQWQAPAPPPPVVMSTPPPYSGEVIIADSAPPPPMVETVYAAPGPDYVWIGGHWGWQGRWVWLAGRYERHPHWHPGGGWEAGHWDHRDRGYVWVEGHWR
jgi:WXXGXW repeat (2 copies)